MKYKNKVIFMEDKLSKEKLIEEVFELDTMSIDYIEKLAKENNTNFNTMINIIITDFLIYIEKEEAQKIYNIKVVDSFEYIDLLENDNFNEDVLIIDYNNLNNKVVSIPYQKYESLKDMEEQLRRMK